MDDSERNKYRGMAVNAISGHFKPQSDDPIYELGIALEAAVNDDQFRESEIDRLSGEVEDLQERLKTAEDKLEEVKEIVT